MSHMFAPPPPDVEYNQRIESDPEFSRACAYTRIVNSVGVGTILLPVSKFVFDFLGATSFVFQVLVAASIAVVPVSILLVLYFRGLVWYNVRTTVPNPSPFFGMFVASLTLTIAGSMNSYMAYAPLFVWSLPIALVIWLAIIFTTNEFKAYTRLDLGNMGAILFICYVFSIGAFMSSNCVYDVKTPKIFPVAITGKKIHEDKDHERSYYLLFTPVAGLDDTQTEVHASFYHSLEVGDTIRFNLKEGVWGVPWYYLEEAK